MSVNLQPKHTVLSAAVAAVLTGAPVAAQEDSGGRVMEEIMVTARRVQESLQDVPLAVSALSSRDISELGISNFVDYALQLPGVTGGGSGPGQNTIYIRGVASTTPNLTVAGVAGLAPNVAFYLDEQPLAQPGRNLDVYAADLQRIEVLSGPQGTLFGASSQAGNVRLITNKPDLNEFYGSAKVGANTISGGGGSTSAELMLNVPVSENFGLRGVFYYDGPGRLDRQRPRYQGRQGQRAFQARGNRSQERRARRRVARGLPGGVGPLRRDLHSHRQQLDRGQRHQRRRVLRRSNFGAVGHHRQLAVVGRPHDPGHRGGRRVLRRP